MSNPYHIDRWFNSSVTIEPMTAYDSHGSPTYGAGAVVKGYISSTTGNVITPDGNEITSDISVLVLGDTVVNPYDRVTLPNADKRIVKAVKTINTPEGLPTMRMVQL